MNETQKEFRRQQSLIVEQLARITDLQRHQCYGPAGRIIKDFSYAFCMEILDKISDRRPLAYIIGALKREYEKTCDFATRQIQELAETWSKG